MPPSVALDPVGWTRRLETKLDVHAVNSEVEDAVGEPRRRETKLDVHPVDSRARTGRGRKSDQLSEFETEANVFVDDAVTLVTATSVPVAAVVNSAFAEPMRFKLEKTIFESVHVVAFTVRDAPE